VGRVVPMTHFARADETESPVTHEQLGRFRQALDGFEAQGSLANSAAIFAWSAAHDAWLRPGLMLYGASPFAERTPAELGITPVMHLQSRVIAVRELAAGEPIGYGARFRCSRPTRMGVVAAGYADGYPRHAVDGTPVAVDGRRTELIGRVSMDMLTVDLTDIPGARVGSVVELWGAAVTANEVAAHSGTIPYELFTGVSQRVPRRYA
jgi:alanine racemase